MEKREVRKMIHRLILINFIIPTYTFKITINFQTEGKSVKKNHQTKKILTTKNYIKSKPKNYVLPIYLQRE